MNQLSTRLRQAILSPSFRSQKKSIFFHPSSASVETESETGKEVIGSCHREQYYRLTEEPTTNVGEPDYAISAAIGDKVSELIVQLIDTHGFKMGLQRLAVEHSFYDPRINVSGRCDIIAWDFTTNEPVGIEVKSVGEYKASKTMDAPSDEHIMQAVIYLDYYRTFIPAGQIIPKKWYIWYCSRTENYSIKSKKHGSPFTMLWDYFITLEDNGTPVIHSHAKSVRMPHLGVTKIHERYKRLEGYVAAKALPPRDYDLSYSPEKITTLYKSDKLTRKADKEVIEKWLNKGAPAGKLKIEMGDFECKMCPWQDKCWNKETQIEIQNTLSNLPKIEETTEEKPKYNLKTLW